jgi:hypothetical protein
MHVAPHVSANAFLLIDEIVLHPKTALTSRAHFRNLVIRRAVDHTNQHYSAALHEM